MSGGTFHVHGPHDHELEHAAQHAAEHGDQALLDAATRLFGTHGHDA